jgi:phosphonate transport system substrate-binding protein
MGDLVFAATLRRNDKAAREEMAQLCALLSEDLGQEVSPLPARAPSALADALSSGEAHFAWISPTLVLMAQNLTTVVPLLACVRGGIAEYNTVLFSAKSSGVDHLDQVCNLRAAWVAPTSASGYLVVRLTLARLGVSLEEAFASESFLETHGAVVEAVLSGAADVGATFAHFDRAAEANILCTGGPIPADMIVAHASVPLRDRFAFAGALCRIAQGTVGREALRSVVGADDFRPVSHQALCELDLLMKASRSV